MAIVTPLSLPEIGKPEMYYARGVKEAEKAEDVHSREAFKVGQYVTLALDPSLPWDQKLKYFKHALRRHCQPPPMPDDDVLNYYRQLSDLVKRYCGQEALRLACAEDDLWATRKQLGQDEDKIADEAEAFFTKIMGGHEQCPEYFLEEDWAQIRMIRDQWM
jgi:hypothetical protein